MKKFDRFLITEFLLFSLLGLACVVLIYDLINLIERMTYFISYKAGAAQIINYYIYDLPQTISLLLPVGCAMGIFLTFGRLIRSNELVPLLASGVDLFRVFAPLLSTAAAIALVSFFSNELISTRLMTKFIEYKEEQIEHRSTNRPIVVHDITYLSASGRLYSIKQLNIKDSTASDWKIWEFGPRRSIQRTLRIDRARYSQKGTWTASNVEITQFSGDEVSFEKFRDRPLAEVAESPGELGGRVKRVNEMLFTELANYIRRRTAAGSSVSEELVEYHFRFSSPLIIVIVTLISLSAASLLRKSNITLGIGIGLLLSFLFWGSIQASRAFGYNGTFPGWLAAWLPNILFLGVSGVLLVKIKR